MARPYRTALIGLGKMGVANAGNTRLSGFYAYSSHIEAIRDHADFDCGASYDKDENNPNRNFSSLEDVATHYDPEILVLATPPQGRLDTIKAFPNLKAVVMEKPVASHYADAKEIVEYCARNNILLQVNYWRRFDKTVIDLKAEIEKAQERPQVIFMTYGNGLRNNAVHLIDQVRYLFGAVSDVMQLSPKLTRDYFPISGDVDLDFALVLAEGGRVYAHALDFRQYREVGMDIWRQRSRIEFMQGGLVMRRSCLSEHRALEKEQEITSDQGVLSQTGAGRALYGLYENLALALKGQEELRSDGWSALENERILDRILS